MTRRSRRLDPFPKSVEEALLAPDPISSIAAIVDPETPAGGVFTWSEACLLETNSATLTILFDRLTYAELTKMEAALASIGASNTLTDLQSLRKAFEALVASGMKELDASDVLDQSPLGREMAARYTAHVAELEERLIAYCKANADVLGAG